MNKFLVIGPPGAGKSTQASMLCQAFGFVRISVGDIFRWHIKNHTKLAARIHRFIDAGQLVPDEVVEEVVKARLEQHDWNYGFVLDGYPASEIQAEFFLESYDIDGAVLLEVPDAIAVERLLNSKVCLACGLDYSLIYHRPKSDLVCDVCGRELTNPGSDNANAGRERLHEYHKKTEPIIEAFRRKELVVAIDATKPPETIQEQIRAELGLSSEAARQRFQKA